MPLHHSTITPSFTQTPPGSTLTFDCPIITKTFTGVSPAAHFGGVIGAGIGLGPGGVGGAGGFAAAAPRRAAITMLDDIMVLLTELVGIVWPQCASHSLFSTSRARVCSGQRGQSSGPMNL